MRDQPPGYAHFGYPLWRAARVRVRALYRVLDEMLAAGWLEDHWEEGERTPRRYYVLTDLGRERLHA